MSIRLAAPLLLVSLVSSGPAAAESKPVVAVFEIENKAKLSPETISSLSEYLAARIAGLGSLETIPRAEIKARLGAQKAESYSACYDESCQIEIGKELAAEKSISAQILRVGNTCVLSLMLYDLRKATSEKAATSKGGCDGDLLLELIDKAVGAMTAATGALQPPPPPNNDAPAVAPLEWVKSEFARVSFTKSEITAAQYQECVDEGACQPANVTCIDRSQGNVPVTCVSPYRASLFCKWVEGRLPTEEEWIQEASAGGTRKFPWGDEEPACSRAVMRNGKGAGCGGGTVLAVCSRPQGNSASGLCDMAGNVWEWMVPGSRTQVARGGSYVNDNAIYFEAKRGVFEFGTGGTTFGFRCVKS